MAHTHGLLSELLDRDLAHVLDDAFGAVLTVTSGAPGVAVSGILDEADQQMSSADADVAGLSTTFLARTRELSAVTIESRVTVAGRRYIVRDRRRVDDGALTRLYLVDV